MPYTCLFTVLTDEAFVDEALEQATALAQGQDAHLEVLCLGVDRSQTGYYYAGASPALLEQTIASAKSDAEAIEAKVYARLEGAPMLWSSGSGIAQLADIARHVAARARFSDLAVLPRPYGDGRGVDMEAATEAVLFEAGVPVFTAPPKTQTGAPPKRVVVGWNESPEALAAVRAALPILKAADNVHLAVIDPPTHGPNRSDPGGPLSQYLARHGVKVEIDVLSRTLPRISAVLQRHTVDVGADLLVMGAYGHSRFREAIFGGATRDLLEGATVPLLLAH